MAKSFACMKYMKTYMSLLLLFLSCCLVLFSLLRLYLSVHQQEGSPYESGPAGGF